MDRVLNLMTLCSFMLANTLITSQRRLIKGKNENLLCPVMDHVKHGSKVAGR